MYQFLNIWLRQGLIWLLVLCLMGCWLLLGIQPAWAQDNTVNYTLANLRYQDFSNEDLSGTSLAGADMLKANFQGANLAGTILTMGSFYKADLTGANLADTFADRVIFSEANLTNAIFTDAMLSGSRFTDAEITGADFTDAILDREQVTLMCQQADGTNPVTGTSTRGKSGVPRRTDQYLISILPIL